MSCYNATYRGFWPLAPAPRHPASPLRYTRSGVGATPTKQVSIRPQLFIDFGVLLFIGAIGDVAEHDCGGTVVAFGLDHDFTLTTDEGTRRTRIAIVPSGCRRAVAGGDARMGVCLVDPGLVVAPTGATDRALSCVRRLAENVQRGFHT